jgi:transposase
VKREGLKFLADNPFYTKRFAYYVGRRCRTATIQDIAKELKLDWHTVKELDKQYMKAQLVKAGKPRPKVIGIDEISIRNVQFLLIRTQPSVRSSNVSTNPHSG